MLCVFLFGVMFMKNSEFLFHRRRLWRDNDRERRDRQRPLSGKNELGSTTDIGRKAAVNVSAEVSPLWIKLTLCCQG